MYVCMYVVWIFHHDSGKFGTNMTYDAGINILGITRVGRGKDNKKRQILVLNP